MCNLSDLVEERGRIMGQKEGREEGREEGRILGMLETLQDMGITKEVAIKHIAMKLNKELKVVAEIVDTILKKDVK